MLPISGALSQAATATVRYKPAGSPNWIVGHPLYRIRPSLTETPGVGTVPEAYAWTIIDLQPGTSYDIEVTANDGVTTNVKTLTHTTRALPAVAPAATITLPAGSTRTQIQTAISQLQAGQVLQLAAGTYNLDAALAINTSAGTENNPVYVRGASRSGVVLSHPGRVIQIQNASHLVIENMTLQGSGVNSVPLPASDGIQFWDGRTSPQTRVTIRNVTMNGVDRAVNASDEVAEILVYDNRLNGNNTWTPELIDTSGATWNDDGIILPGTGNAAFNNTLRGFGDTFAYGVHSAGICLTENVGIHFYRNDIRNSGDDLVEVDCGHRNLSFYDNRSHNSMTFISLDPLYGGPFLAARNISINTGRPPYKWNAPNSGQFIYNNTVVRTTGKAVVVDNAPQNEAGWIQFDNGAQNSYGYRNNLLVYRGTGTYTLRLGNSGHDPVDFTHNSWYPSRQFLWPQGTFADLAAAYAGLAATTPVFSGISKRHEQDNITDSDPWVTDVVLGADYHTEVTGPYTPALSPGSTPKNSGVIIPNVTDGFNLGAPDRGAIIEGRPVPAYGDRSSP